MGDVAGRAARLDELWDAFVLGLSSGPSGEDRLESALRLLRACRHIFEEATAASDEDRALGALNHGRAIWTLIAVEAADWLVDTPGLDVANESRWSERARAVLIGQLYFATTAIPPTHRAAIDPVPVMLPKWLFSRLVDAMEALDKGEVHPIVQPAAGGRHDAPWTWDMMRARALEHVAFLHGQGVALQIARRRVGAAMKVAAATLRAWETECRRSVYNLNARIATARDAGDIKARRDQGGDETPSESADANALALLQSVQEESLSEFAARYRERFGQRHHTSSVGD